jgi:hypothetical protein
VLEYVISVDDLRGSPAEPPWNLHAVAAELREMTKATKELNEIIRMPALSRHEGLERAPAKVVPQVIASRGVP